MRFVDQWRTVLWLSATTWVTAAVHTIMAVVGVHFAVLLGVVPFVPSPWQLPIALVVALLTMLPTLIARVWPQPKMAAKIEEKRDAE